VSPIDDDELDRLADYVAGVLDPVDAARVRQLVDTDPTWARAYAGLDAAGSQLDAELAGLADPPMPGDVAERLRAVLALQSPPRDARTDNVVHLSSWRRRWTRGTAGVAAVAAAVFVIFFSIAQLSTSVSNNTSTSSGAAAQPGAAPVPNKGAFDSGSISVTHSGTDYTAGTLPGARAALPTNGGPEANPGVPTVASGDAPLRQNDAGTLDRLAGPVTLGACLMAITQRYGGQPTAVDYARFEGSPALIVQLSGGTRRVVVVGPKCGLPGSGADERYAVSQ
jgi:hypothetical protein